MVNVCTEPANWNWQGLFVTDFKNLRLALPSSPMFKTVPSSQPTGWLKATATNFPTLNSGGFRDLATSELSGSVSMWERFLFNLFSFVFFSPALAKAKLGYSYHCHKSVCLYACLCVCPAVHEVLFLRNLKRAVLFSLFGSSTRLQIQNRQSRSPHCR